MRWVSRAVLSSLFLGGLFGCGSPASTPSTPTTPSTPSPPATGCTFSVAVADAPFNAAGGPGSVTVSTGPQCRWSAHAGSDTWVKIPLTAVVGPGTLTLTVDPNRSFSSRSAEIRIVDDKAAIPATQVVTQRGAGCLYSVEPTTLTANQLGTSDGSDVGMVQIRVHAEPSDCSWTAAPDVPWLFLAVLSPRSGTGDGYVNLAIGMNSSSTRVGELVVRGLSGLNPDAHLVVTQTGR